MKLLTRDSSAIILVTFLVGGGGLSIAYNLLWRRSQAMFWLVAALIAAALVWIVATGTYLNIARSLWPIVFDEARGPEIKRRLSCEGPRPLITALILAPVMLALLLWMFKPIFIEQRYGPRAILTCLGFALLWLVIYYSPIPEHLAPLILPEDRLTLPSYCGQNS